MLDDEIQLLATAPFRKKSGKTVPQVLVHIQCVACQAILSGP